MKRVVVIGAGIGGLAAAAALARRGFEVTVLEAHVYPGGCAGTFFHQGYHFDAGATLAGGFYTGGPMDLLAQSAGIASWPGRPAAPAMVVHLPDGTQVARWGDERRWQAYQSAFGDEAARFWSWQEGRAEALWNLAMYLPNWPPQSVGEIAGLTRSAAAWLSSGGAGPIGRLPFVAQDAFRSLAAQLRLAPENLKLFVDAQLLISAQASSSDANALYGAAALDLPRRGVLHLPGGMGTISQMLAQAVRDNSGRVQYRQQARRIHLKNGKPAAVETRRGGYYEADIVLGNLTPWNMAEILGDLAPRRLRRLPARPRDGWGAFMLYLGVDSAIIPTDFPLHHQVILQRPLGEGNTIFLSISPEWDGSRAPAGKRAITISTHTDLASWWDQYENDRQAYGAQKDRYTENLFLAAERVLPGLRQAAELILPGTPVSFERFTRRRDGWVGGFPQTSILRALGPRLGPGLWLVGDSIFPGQSVAAAGLGGLRVADAIARKYGLSAASPMTSWNSRQAAV